MSIIYMDSTKSALKTRHLVQSAIEAEIARLELAVKNARKRLTRFEQKYNVSSEQFIKKMAAEDLDGGDEEYVEWFGEYRLLQKLSEKLSRLEGVEYGDSNVFLQNQNRH